MSQTELIRTAESHEPQSNNGLVEHVAELLEMKVDVRVDETCEIGTLRFFATAQAITERETFYGYGSGASSEVANRKAVMECAERYTQFGCLEPESHVVETYSSLRPNAIFPPECGLYSQAQYSSPDFGLTPFSDRDSLEWVEVSNLATEARSLIPLEFIYPRARLCRSLIVAETSSGTAINVDREAAILGALCEVIERDALMLFWYRQPQTRTIPIETISVPKLRNELLRIQSMGFVVVVCHLVYDLDVPCFLVIALKGETFIYGSGCHPNWSQALEHALSELHSSLFWSQTSPDTFLIHQPLTEVRVPMNHYDLYNRGPMHHVLRQVLNNVLRPGRLEDEFISDIPALSDSELIHKVLDRLLARGYQAYVCGLTSPSLATSGVHVVRVLVPGLIPIHFGYNRLRLGCKRLWTSEAPGRLVTMLPHFVS